jgi:hypothetical protein
MFIKTPRELYLTLKSVSSLPTPFLPGPLALCWAPANHRGSLPSKIHTGPRVSFQCYTSDLTPALEPSVAV